MECQLFQNQRQRLNPSEFAAYRRILYINKSTLDKATINDFQYDFYDISTNTIYEPIKSKNYRKKLIYNLRNKGYVIASSKKTKPQGYYAIEYKHLDMSKKVTLDTAHILNPSEIGNSSSLYEPPRDISELLQFGIHDILFCPHVKGSHKKFLNYGLREDPKRNITVKIYLIHDLKFTVRSSNQDSLMIHVSTSRNQIMINNPTHLKLFNHALDELTDLLSKTYNIDNIPHHNKWIIKLWHYATDFNNNEASGERFHVTWKDAKGIFNRVYSKKIPFHQVITRYEVQEVPNLTKELAIQSKKG